MNIFIDFLSKLKDSSNYILIESIESGYKLLFEGINDMKFVFNAEDWITKIVHKIRTNQPTFRSIIKIHDDGFEYICDNAYKTQRLHIRWIPTENDARNMYDSEHNIIWILFSEPYIKSKEGLVDIVINTNDTLIHELRHWFDHVTYNIENNKYTNLSQIENKSLKDVGNAVFSMTNDKYINLTSELNAHICEFIHTILNEILENDIEYTFDDLIDIFTSMVDMTGITKDTLKRLNKRLYVFSKGLDYLYTIKADTSLNLRKELVDYLTKYTGIIESIDYNHSDILNKRNLVFFEANYKTDTEYRDWFNKKYVNHGKCISTFHKI